MIRRRPISPADDKGAQEITREKDSADRRQDAAVRRVSQFGIGTHCGSLRNSSRYPELTSRQISRREDLGPARRANWLLEPKAFRLGRTRMLPRGRPEVGRARPVLPAKPESRTERTRCGLILAHRIRRARQPDENAVRDEPRTCEILPELRLPRRNRPRCGHGSARGHECEAQPQSLRGGIPQENKQRCSVEQAR